MISSGRSKSSFTAWSLLIPFVTHSLTHTLTHSRTHTFTHTITHSRTHNWKKSFMSLFDCILLKSVWTSLYLVHLKRIWQQIIHWSHTPSSSFSGCWWDLSLQEGETINGRWCTVLYSFLHSDIRYVIGDGHMIKYYTFCNWLYNSQ